MVPRLFKILNAISNNRKAITHDLLGEILPLLMPDSRAHATPRGLEFNVDTESVFPIAHEIGHPYARSSSGISPSRRRISSLAFDNVHTEAILFQPDEDLSFDFLFWFVIFPGRRRLFEELLGIPVHSTLHPFFEFHKEIVWQ